MGGFSLWHILIVGIFVLLLFGGNRFSSMMGDVAKGLKSFKQGLSDDDEQKQRQLPHDPAQPPPYPPVQQQPPQVPIDLTPNPPAPTATPMPPSPAPGDEQPR